MGLELLEAWRHPSVEEGEIGAGAEVREERNVGGRGGREEPREEMVKVETPAPLAVIATDSQMK
jgi:hypothetical protein